MRTMIFPGGVKLWLSTNDTYNWAHNWPGSQLRGKSLFAEFDRGGLVDVAINGRSEADVDVKGKLRPAIEAWMEKEGYFPNVWEISDHGNAQIVTDMTGWDD
jgi:hypothetical protein